MCLDRCFIDIIRHAYLSSYQILSTEAHQTDFADPKAKGAGFIIEFDGCKYLVSALHVIDPKNFPDFTSWNQDPKVGIISGKNDEANHYHLCLPVGGFQEYTNMPRPKDEDDLVFPVPLDLAFTKEVSCEQKCFSLGFEHQLVRIEAGAPKEHFSESELNPNPSREERFFIVGSIYELENPLQAKFNHQLHLGLKIIEETPTHYTLETPYDKNQMDQWSGLSGSAVVSEAGKVIGMLTNASDTTNRITVMKLDCIFEIINRTNRIEIQHIDTHEPVIIVGPGTTLQDLENNPALKQMIELIKSNRAQ